MLEPKITIEAIRYILEDCGECDKLKIIKLLYFADKYHLMKYGQSITNDRHIAMEHGPVNSLALDILCFNDLVLHEDEINYTYKLLKQTGKYTFIANIEFTKKLNYLSESGKEALDYIIQRFGKMSGFKLTDYAHRLPEWKQYKELLQGGIRSKAIKTIDVFSPIDDNFDIPEDHIEESKELFSGKL